MLSPLGEGKKKGFKHESASKSGKHGNDYGSPLSEGGAKKGVGNSSSEGVLDGIIPLSYPEVSGPIDPLPHLSALRDNGSSFEAVTKSCFHLNQYAATRSTSTTDDVPGPSVCEIFHDPSYAKTISSVLSVLMDCASNHHDRRCRILACKTLAIVARSAYARIRHSPLLFSIRDGTLNRIEDEVGTDVAVTLSNVALDDADDGVSACAVQALGMLTLSTVSMAGSLTEDELFREIESIIHSRPSPYAPSLIALEDEDISVPMEELQCRIYENVMSPRLFRLICRITCYDTPMDCCKTLPFLTACLIHVIKTNPATTFGMDRASYAKRWMEFDVAGMAHEIVYSILLPAMQSSLNTALAYTAAQSGIRLAHVCPNAPWMLEVCQWAIVILSENLATADMAEMKTSISATLLVALRAIPVSERVSYLEKIVNHVQSLPFTNTIPFGVSSPGVLQNLHGIECYQRPARIGLFTEIALSLFLDGPVDHTVSHNRSKALNLFLMGSAVNTILTSRSNNTKSKKSAKSKTKGAGGKPGLESWVSAASQEGVLETHAREELVLTFCMVASAVGKCVMVPGGSSKPSEVSHIGELGEWLRCSLSLLSTFAACLSWHSQTRDETVTDEDNDVRTQFTVGFAAKAAYLSLFQECLYTAGLISPVSSVSLNVMPRATPSKSIFLEQLVQASSSLLNYAPVSGFDFAFEYLITLADIFLEYKIREGLPSRHMRILLLALLSDHWVQQLQVAIKSETTSQKEGGNAASIASANLNELNAQEILATLATEIAALNKILGESNGNNRTTGAKSIKQYLVVCVACVENIALTACEWKRRYGAISPPVSSPASSNDSFSQDIAEDANHLVSVATAALQGRNIRDDDTVGDDSVKEKDNGKEKPLHPVCSSAIERIRSAVDNDAQVNDDASWGVAGQPTLFSALVMDIEMNSWDGSPKKAQSKPEVAPLLSGGEAGSSQDPPLLTGDAYCSAFLAQHCQQAILSRIDLSMRSSAFADRFDYIAGDSSGKYSIVRTRPRNWLRLTPPPLPPVRFVPKTVNAGTRLCWGCSTATVSACSDPISVMLAHAVRRYPRHDGETEFKLTITIRLYNVTPVEIAHGVRMDLRVSHQNESIIGTDEFEGILNSFQALDIADKDDSDSAKEKIEGESKSTKERKHVKQNDEDELISPSTIVYKDEVSSGDYLTWEVTLDRLPTKGAIVLHPSVTFREIEVEQPTSRWIGPPSASHDEDENDDKGEDDSAIVDEADDEGDETTDVTVGGKSVSLSPLIMLQPCPLVFFRDGCGDVNAFRFLWFNMPHRIQPRTLRSTDPAPSDIAVQVDELGQAVARLSLMRSQGEDTKAWAFLSLSGKRVLCVISEDISNQSHELAKTAKTCTLNARGDDQSLILSLFGTKSSRAAVVSALTCDAWRCDELHVAKT